MKKNITYFLIALFLFTGCAGQHEQTRGDQPKPSSSSKNYDESFDPLSLNDDDIVIEPKPLSKSPAVPSTSASEGKTAVTSTSPESKIDVIPGYRVQIFTTSDINKADEFKNSVQSKFQADVYRVYEAPYYRIRVGDCVNRDEAEKLREEAQQKGFRDAWIVRDQVFIKK